eukprot:985042_1
MHWIASSCTQIIALGCILRNFASLCDLFYLDHLNINYIIQPIYPTDFVMDYQELGAQFDWKTASKKQIDDAYQNNELIKVSSTTNSKCHAPSVSDHFTLLRHKTTTDDDESAAKIIDYSVCWKCDKLYTTKRNKNRDKSKLYRKIQRNYAKVQPTVTYWINKNKLTKNEKAHKCLCL